jgi:hypothetical protein
MKFTAEDAYKLTTQPTATQLYSLLSLTAFSILSKLGLACIVIHTFAILSKKTASLGATVQTLASHAFQLITWAIIAAIIQYSSLAATHAVTNYLQDASWPLWPLDGITTILGIIWGLAIFFMIQILSLEKLSLLQSFARSCTLARKLIIEVFAGYIAYGLSGIVLLPIVPFAFAASAFFTIPENYQPLLTSCLTAILIMIFSCIYTIFATRLYYEHYQDTRS